MHYSPSLYRPHQYFCVFLLSLILLPTIAGAQIFPLDDPFQVNQYTTGNQGFADVGFAADGSFVVVWESEGQDGDLFGVFGRRHAEDGTALGDEFQINTATTEEQFDPEIAVGPSGEFVVVWRSWGQDGNEYGIFGQRYDSAGAAAGDEFQINEYTTGSQEHAEVVYDESGNFLIVWESDGQDGSFGGVYARHYGSDGQPLTDEFQVHTTTIDEQNDPDAAAIPGGFIVVWESDGIDSSGEAVVLQRFDSDAMAVGDETQVNQSGSGDQEDAAIAAQIDGTFAVVWESDGQDGSTESIVGRVFNSSATPLSDEALLNSTVTGPQQDPEVAVDGAGRFVAAWEGPTSGNNFDVYARLFDAAGENVGDEFLVNTTTNDQQVEVSVAGGRGGRFVVGWHSLLGDDGDGATVFSRRLSGSQILQDGFESGDTAVWTAVVP